MAAKSGVVTTSTYNNSYGNYVVVSHSDGTSTLYAHMSRRGCSKGDVVSQGQISVCGHHRFLHRQPSSPGGPGERSRVDPTQYFSVALYMGGARVN